MRRFFFHNSKPGSAVLEALKPFWNQLSGNDFTYSTDHPHGCIDYVFALRSATPVLVLSAQVLASETIRLSDHFPVRLRLCF